MTCSFSKSFAHNPIIKPNRLNDMQVSIRKVTIHTGCAIFKSTKKLAVISMTIPMIKDLVAAAPTKPIRISIKQLRITKML